MSEADLLTPAPAKKRGPRRRWLFVAWLGLLPLVLLGGIYLILAYLAERNLREAIAEADRLDPGWRLDDLLARRPEYADDDNSALQVLRSKALIPKGWTVKPETAGFIFRVMPPPLDTQRLKALHQELDKMAAAVAEARKLADMPHGRFPTPANALDALEVARLLQYDALLLAQEGDLDGALRSTCGVLNVGRSLADEPALHSQLVRLACRQIVSACLERVLAHGEPSIAALTGLQRVLEEEEADNPMLHALRGERADHEHMMENLQNGSIRVVDLPAIMKPSKGAELEFTLLLNSSSGRKNQRAAMLRILTQFVETAKLPPEQQPEKYKKLDAEIQKHGLFVRLWLPGLSLYAADSQVNLARLRCAIVAVAAERYRRAHGAWAASLEALVAGGLLKGAPADPYDGAPLRYQVRDDRVVIYSVGPDLQDNGGTFKSKTGAPPGFDLGLTLWNVEQRRLPPLPTAEPPAAGQPNVAPSPGAAPPPGTKEPDQ